MTDRRLNLAEELLLLALDERRGTVLLTASTGLPYGLAGAALIELSFRRLIRIEDKELVPTASGGTGDDLLDGILEKLRASGRHRSVQHWVANLGQSAGRLKEGFLERLIARGVLRQEEGRLLWVLPLRTHPEADPQPEAEIRSRLRAALLGETRPDERTAALVALVHSCDLVNALCPKDERRRARQRAKEIAEAQPVGSAVARAVAAVKAAVIVAATTASS